jgi:hypothetical protein
MQKNLYYRTVLRRHNIFLDFVYGIFLGVASWTRLLIEVFTRKNFGERYFRLSSALTVGVILIAYPLVMNRLLGSVGYDASEDADGVVQTGSSFLKPYYSWFAFMGLFLAVSIYRKIEIKRNPSVFDFAKFSLYSGKINPFFFTIPVNGKKPTIRIVETVIEPLPFLILGIVLFFLHQPLGSLLILTSLFYGMGYVAAYHRGDDFVMDKIDEIISNEELKKAFVDGLDDSETRGFRFLGHRPDDPEIRRQILPLMTEEEDNIAVAR